MTTKIISTVYGAAYQLGAPVTTLSIAGTGYVAGSATYGIYTGTAATAAYDVVNHGTVKSGGTAVSLGDGGLVINGTPGDAAPLINGATDICESSRPMKDVEKADVQAKRGAPAVETKVALDALAVYVNDKSPVHDISIPALAIACSRRNVLPMPPVASTTAGASKNTNFPVSRK